MGRQTYKFPSNEPYVKSVDGYPLFSNAFIARGSYQINAGRKLSREGEALLKNIVLHNKTF